MNDNYYPNLALLCYNGGMIINSTNNKPIQIDDEDLGLVSQHPWTVASDGYAKKYFEIWNGGKNRKRWVVHMHRLIMGAKKGQMIDHINGDTTDNRRCNLRFSNKSLNAINSNKVKSSTGFRGVVRNAQKGKPFMARIMLAGKQIYLGRYDTPEEASKAYLTKQREVLDGQR